MQRYNKCPLDLQQSQLEIVVSDDVERDAQRQSLQVSICCSLHEQMVHNKGKAMLRPAAPKQFIQQEAHGISVMFATCHDTCVVSTLGRAC